MAQMRSTTQLHVFDTDPDLFASFSRLFGEERGNTSRWVKLTTADGVDVTFFAADSATRQADPVASDEIEQAA